MKGLLLTLSPSVTAVIFGFLNKDVLVNVQQLVLQGKLIDKKKPISVASAGLCGINDPAPADFRLVGKGCIYFCKLAGDNSAT